MYPLKQSTAITIPFFAHDVNGDAVTGKIDANWTKRISKGGGAFAAMTVTVTEMENGWYSIPLSTTHTDTLEILSLTFTATGVKQVNLQFRVHARLPDNLAFPTTSGNSIDVTATGEVGIDWANIGAPTTAQVLSGTTIGTATAVTTVNGLAASVITATSIATDAITAAKIATDAIGASELAADAVIEIRSLASGTSDSGTTTTMVDAARTEADTDYWKDQIIVFTSGNIAGQARLITAFNAATDTVTFSPALTQAVATQTYEIWPQGRIDVGSWNGTTVQTPDTAGYPVVTIKDGAGQGEINLTAGAVDSVTTVAAVTVVNGLAANVITAASINAAAITAAKFGVDAIDANALAANATAEIAAAVWNEDATGHQTLGTFGQAIGDPVADTNTIFKAVVTDATGATVGVDVVNVQADTDNIQTRLPAALVGGRMDSSIGAITAAVITNAAFAAGAIDAAAIATNAIDADALAADAVTEIRSLVSGTSDSGTTTTMVDAARIEADVDYWKGLIILFTSGTISGQARLITAFNPTTDTITFVPAVTAAVALQNYEILTAGAVDVRLWNGAAQNNLIAGRVDADVAVIQANVITAGVIATDAIGAAELAADAVTEIQAGLATAASIAALNNISTTQVKTQVTDALNVDTYAEIGQETPAATQTIRKMLGYLYKTWRNKSTQTSSLYQLFNDDTTTVSQKATVSDDGTTFTRDEVATGP